MTSSLSLWIENTPPMPKGFTANTLILEQRNLHEKAKASLKKVFTELSKGPQGLNSCEADFVRSPRTPIPQDWTQIQIGALDQAVFSWEKTNSVGADIQRDGNDTAHTNIYMLSSQFNSVETTGRYPIRPGTAYEHYQNDRTQGPEVQIQFRPEQAEAINCAANEGLNGLVYVLNEKTQNAVEYGYFAPTGNQLDAVIKDLRDKHIEYLCVRSVPTRRSQKIHQFFGAAPHYSPLHSTPQDEEDKNYEIQFLTALHCYRAQLHYALQVAEMDEKPIIVKIVALGLGVFNNNPKAIAKAFYQAGKEYEQQLKTNRVSVRLQLFQNGYNARGQPTPAREMAQLLKLKEISPISHTQGRTRSLNLRPLFLIITLISAVTLYFFLSKLYGGRRSCL